MEMTLEHFGIPRLLTLQNQGTERAPGLTDGEEIRMEGKYIQGFSCRKHEAVQDIRSLKNPCPLK